MTGRKADIKARYLELCGLIEKYNRHYYTLDSPLVSDAEYDGLMRELLTIERKYPSLKREDSPTQRVGDDISPVFTKVLHDPPMLSLGNIFTREDLLEFDRRCAKSAGSEGPLLYSGELKFDGLAVEVVYRNGRMVQGSTRGNGAEGEDVTANLSTVRTLPLFLKGSGHPDYLSVRGEVFLTHDEFDRLNGEREREGEPPFANPRNAAAGSLRQLDSRVTERRNLDIVFYGVGRVSGIDIRDQEGFYRLMDEYGIPGSSYRVIGTVEEIQAFHAHWYEHRHELEFDIDGVVVKASDFAVREAMGATSKAPRWAAAWKFPSAEAVTLLESVEFSIGRTGVVTPVANLRPINIGGVMVKRATLHNFSEVKRLGVKTGDTVTVKRAGDVIPKITSVHQAQEGGGGIVAPERCPSCGTQLRQEDIFLRCVNRDCETVRVERLKFFVSKDGMDIEYFGPELINRLFAAGLVATAADIYGLTRENLLGLERMGEKLADKILESIGSRRRVPLSHFIKAMGIKNVGEHIARVIARKAKTLETLISMTMEDLKGIHEVGPQVAESVYGFFHDDPAMSDIARMRERGFSVSDEEGPSEESAFAGKTFVFTGTLAKRTRKECEKMVTDRGGRAAGSVSAKTDFVVAGESAGSKLKKAQELGIAVLSEDEFIEMTGEG